jgi:hypothetical protein
VTLAKQSEDQAGIQSGAATERVCLDCPNLSEPLCLELLFKSESIDSRRWSWPCSWQSANADDEVRRNTIKENPGGFMKQNAQTKYFFAAALFAAFGWMSVASAYQEIPPVHEVTVGVSDAFVPGGFDSHSEAFVVVNGMFPNGCYRWKGAEVKHLDRLNHEVRSIASVSQGLCTMAMIPFTQEVRLGTLESGVHELKFMNGDGTYLLKKMTIE